jgi:hypothetical protein
MGSYEASIIEYKNEIARLNSILGNNAEQI